MIREYKLAYSGKFVKFYLDPV